MLIGITLWEFISVLLCTAFLFSKCLHRGIVCKAIILTISLVFAAILGGQLSDLLVTGRYVDVLTLSNIYSYSDVGWKILLSSAFIVFVCLGLTLFVAITAKKGWYKIIGWQIVAYCLFFWCVNPQGAVQSFVRTCYSTVNQSFYSPNAKMRDLQQKMYAKDSIYDNDVDVSRIFDLRGKNVVVVFAEGFAAEFIEKFNHHKGLTPNLDKFLDEGVYFKDYFNHTASTFRGLRGQLTSSYQLRRGYSNTDVKNGLAQISGDELKKTLSGTLISVPHILRDHNYHSYFLSTHLNNYQLNMMLQTLEFDRVYGADDFLDTNNELTDQQLFSTLSDLINNNKLQKPFFIGTYNLGTHFGQDSPDLKYGDGSNCILNTIRNFDDAFGKFWNSVKDRDDIVVVLTADHAVIPGKLYVATFGTDRSFPINQVPFVVWNRNFKHQVLDAKGRNSLDLAPTLLQAMGIRNAPNYFLGCSVFDSSCPRPFEHIANVDDGFWETPSLRALDPKNPKEAEIMQKVKDFYNLSEDRRYL